MTKSVLIIGYGRAGKRHAKMAKEGFGLEPYIYDPYTSKSVMYSDGFSVIYHAPKDILPQADYSYTVIATPPDSHLRYIRLCLDNDLPVLCEKPLCAIGQLDKAKALLNHPNADKVMVAYNWRYHPKLVEVKNQFKSGLFLDCSQYRNDLPEWGLLLDHCSHDLDILRFVTSDELEVENVQYHIGNRGQEWNIILSGFNTIREMVTHQASKRLANLYYNRDRFIELNLDPQMFVDMWQAFLNGNYGPGLEEAIKTQELLEACYQINERRNGD